MMKRITGLLVLALFLAVPSLALAAEQMGVYVTPKFVYGYTQMKMSAAALGYGTFAEGNEYDSVFGGALAVGYDVNKKFRIPLRAELEYALFSTAEGETSQTWYMGGNPYWRDSIKQKLQIQTLFVNAYYDFHNRTAFTPYLGGGLGLAFVRAKGSNNWTDYLYSVSGTDKFGAKTTTNFAWNVGLGATYDITNWCSIDLGYRFAGLGKGKTNYGGTLGSYRIKTKNIYMHQVTTGVRFTF